MITKEAVELIQQTAVKAAGVAAEIMPAADEPEGVYYVRGANGLMARTVALPCERFAADTVESLVRLTREHDLIARIFHSPGTPKGVSPGASIVGTFGARGRVTLAVTHSEPFAKLQRWSNEGGALLSQLDLWGLLRTTFYGTLPPEFDLIAAIRRVDIKKAQEATSTVDRKGTSMSRSIVAEASGADKLPETFVLFVPVYEGAIQVMASVRCALDLDASVERFRVSVLPGQIADAMEHAAATIENLIYAAKDDDQDADQDAVMFVYRGGPGE